MSERAQNRRTPKNARLPKGRSRHTGSKLKMNLLRDELQEYSLIDLERLFGLPDTLVKSLAHAKYITAPEPAEKTSYSFHDLLILRTASALRSAGIATARITAAVGYLRTTLPPDGLLTTMALAAADSNVILGEGSRGWEESPIPLTRASALKSSQVVARLAPRSQPPAVLEAEAHYARGHALEDSDLAAARVAYLEALQSHRDHLEARINLGRLLHLDGDLEAAEKVYRAARTSSALLSFNLAVLLEDLNREAEAVAAYRQSLAQDPTLHEAHFNLSLLYDRAKQPREALRHSLAFRRHIARYGEG
jgi:tetratricopeptide (TPR) repeat protein